MLVRWKGLLAIPSNDFKEPSLFWEAFGGDPDSNETIGLGKEGWYPSS